MNNSQKVWFGVCILILIFGVITALLTISDDDPNDKENCKLCYIKIGRKWQIILGILIAFIAMGFLYAIKTEQLFGKYDDTYQSIVQRSDSRLGI